ncbi:transcriptional regulator, TetR family [Monaibacterium marinum]|uniref:Transcriptional regulator, TetR family n=1 Tax=Pontivivens marinum TaxID=1690039 RepID=A0A2C9CMK3_9RHOB|nr:TetR/AcrR family transcriptional regulator [Monaibacterium marinum]SOH92437.1 transcriptional regulator, TetR family [Monaibacterium marinum]
MSDNEPKHTDEDRGSYHHGDLRRALLDAMGAVVTREGIDAVSLRGLARMVGVAPSAAFRHFRDKRALVTAYSCEAINELVVTARAKRDAVEGDAVRFEAIILAFIGFAREQPQRFRALNRRELVDIEDLDWLQAGLAMDQLVFETLNRPDADANPRLQAARNLLAWAAVHGLVTLAMDGWISDADPDDPLGAPEISDAYRLLVALVSQGRGADVRF